MVRRHLQAGFLLRRSRLRRHLSERHVHRAAGRCAAPWTEGERAVRRARPVMLETVAPTGGDAVIFVPAAAP
jgi:hypothetical protein